MMNSEGVILPCNPLVFSNWKNDKKSD